MIGGVIGGLVGAVPFVTAAVVMVVGLVVACRRKKKYSHCGKMCNYVRCHWLLYNYRCDINFNCSKATTVCRFAGYNDIMPGDTSALFDWLKNLGCSIGQTQ